MAETPQNTARALLVAPSVGFAEDAAGYWFDKKFVEGMRLFRTLWGGPLVSAMKRVEKASLPFGDYYTLDELPFELIPRAPGEELSASQVASAAAVLAAGDNHDQLGLCLDEAERRPPVCYILEHDQPTRYQLVWLDGRPLGARLKSLVWTWLIDRRRKAAVSRAEAIQANGAPAMASYSPLQPNALLFFDTRMRDEMLATPAEMEARAARLRSGAPLRLVFSGRFERIKGVRHLPLVAAALKKRGVDFSFEIFGTGSLESEVASAIAKLGLEDCMALKGVLDFETELVPHVRREADIFVCCHRQADPSCTYLETYGCGAPIAGYRNAAFEGVRRRANAGWSERMDDPARLADVIARLDKIREEIIAHAYAALAFAREHSFENTFERRIAQLKELTVRANG